MLQLNCNVNTEDFEKCQAYILANQPPKWTIMLFLKLGLWVLLGVLFTQVDGQLKSADRYLNLIAFVLVILTIAILPIWRKRGGMLTWYQQLSGDYQWEICAAGISITILADTNNERRTAFFAWPQVMAIAEDHDAWYVYLTHKAAIAIPKRALTLGDVHDFNIQVAQYWSAHPDNDGLHLQTQAPTERPQKSFWADLFQNVRLGFKNAFFMTVHPLSYRVRNSQLVGLMLLSASVIAFFEYLRYYPDAMFNIYGVSHHIVSMSLFLLACMAIVYQLCSQAWLTRLTIILLTSTLAATTCLLCLRALPTMSNHLQWGLWWVYVLWVLAISYRSIKTLFKLPIPYTIFMVATFIYIAMVLPGIFGQQTIFTEDYRKAAEKYQQNIDQEAVYYQQPQFVENTVSGLAAQRAGVTDMYFVGFAGYGYQKVFANEVKFAQQLFDKQFDTKKRSATLITHESTLNTTPLANTYNLANMLNGVAKKMDVNEDILFLFLSSHGSRTFELSVSLYPFEMKNLSANDVKIMLDKAGIKNRVIVVSACYSGGFIEALKDEKTLIITAARKDRSSFGCSEEAEYTYFGDAYFVQALQKEKSFSKAFEQAKKIIAVRERTEQKGEKSSLPQMYEGAAIKPKLEAWLNTLQ